MNWYYVWMYQPNISEDFIREFKHRLHNWLYLICDHRRTFSQDFIEDFIEEIGWDNICRYQTLSEDFIEKHKEDILFDILVNNDQNIGRIA